ncbi:hypothetical protein NC652_022203 [Populus alba x Populus x berolinensis]|uniref:Uncharacterized protein n=1 Tax=Populus alba x Populus x berolinensis TaxID=444605 RepID=A0AAD6QFC9_9ROSI|nr:hypothetical protein NC652_022203 [Populus alba x Populus x berolinensis]KAJ6989330.1 hypothetical protein NC653_022038 [Populus alba x Populus x berolinensis]
MILHRIQPPVKNSSKQSPAYIAEQMEEQLHCESATNDLKYHPDLYIHLNR